MPHFIHELILKNKTDFPIILKLSRSIIQLLSVHFPLSEVILPLSHNFIMTPSKLTPYQSRLDLNHLPQLTRHDPVSPIIILQTQVVQLSPPVLLDGDRH